MIKSVKCRADKSKQLKRWKEKKEDEAEVLIASMRSKDIISLKEESTKLMLRLKEEAENKNQPNDGSIKGGSKEDLKEEDDGKAPPKKPRNSLGRRMTEFSSCSLEEYFKRRKEE